MKFTAKSGNVATYTEETKNGKRSVTIAWSKKVTEADMREFDDWYVRQNLGGNVVGSRKFDSIAEASAAAALFVGDEVVN